MQCYILSSASVTFLFNARFFSFKSSTLIVYELIIIYLTMSASSSFEQ